MIISKTPLRISFFGGGTDFREWYRAHGGAVLSAVIDKYVYVCVNKRFEDNVRVSYSRTEIVDKASDLQHDLVRAALQMFDIEYGIEIVTIADVPGTGTGLGSSSALAVGLANALSYYVDGYQPSGGELAHSAIEIEVGVLRKPIGEQDQYIAGMGGLRHLLWDIKGYKGQYADLGKYSADLQSTLLLFYLDKARDSNTILTDMRANLEANSESMFKVLNSVARGGAYVWSRGWQQFGELLNEMWQLKRGLADGISTPEIDILYQRALDAGAWGGKVCGAGGGGFLLICAPPDAHGAIRDALGLRELRFRLGVDGSQVTET